MKKVIATLTLITFILSSCWVKEVPIVEKNLKEVKVLETKKAQVIEQIKLIWKVVWDKETLISSQISWLINKINVWIWDNIKKDQVLANIDTNSQVWVWFNNAQTALNNSSSIYSYTTESIKKDIELAKLQLENTKNNRDNVYALTEKQLNIAQRQEENINNTKSNTDITNKENLANAKITLELAKKSLNTANINLDNFNKNKEETLKSIKNKKISLLRNIVSNIQSSYINIDSSLNASDLLIGVTDQNKNYNDSFESYLWAKSPTSKTNIESELKDLIETYWKNISHIKSLSSKLETDIKNNIDDTSNYSLELSNSLDYITKIKLALSDVIDVLNNSITSIPFPQTSLESQKTIISLKQSSVLQSENNLITLKNSLEDINNTISWTKTNLDTQEITIKNAIDLSSIQFESAKQSVNLLNANIWLNTSNLEWNVKLTNDQLDSTITTIKNSKDQVDNAVKIAESQLNSSIAKLNSQLVQTKATLDNTKWQKDLATIGINNSIIKVPFDSTIVSKNIELWTLVNPWSPLFIVASSEKFKIKLDITSDNASYIKEWDSVKIELMNWQTSTWIISLSSKNANPQTNLFPVEISFDNKQLKSKIWDFVTIYIDKKLWDKYQIMLPFESILNPSDWVYSVFVLSWSIANSREVKLWIKNSSQVEIISWLKEWEKVIINKVADLENLEEVKVEN